MNRLFMLLYLSGYSGRAMPRQVRRLIAGTEFHRAWLLGSMGFFEQDGIRYGPARPYGIAPEPERA
ncbi:hypothetical protein [Paracoccus sp. FO-3]|uniref:hypothetical protein n=1 Tax=Paracoccus sp. FO-3 TaxID=1335059 RepID=UPI00112E34FF|nr:hypothetical protein [Paracoccus sp. FO-3]